MKKLNFLILTATTLFASCSKKLPNASITGATFGDYIPWGMMIVGFLFLIYCLFDQLKNGKDYTNNIKNPAVTRFVFGAGGAILLIMGFVIIYS